MNVVKKTHGKIAQTAFAAIFLSILIIPSAMASSQRLEKTSGPSAGGIKFGLAFSPSNPDIIYVDRFKSVDGGETWTELNLPESTVNNIAVNPENPSIVYVALANVLYKSIDGGKTWIELRTLGSDDSVISALSTGTNNVIYAGTTHGRLFKSIDGGSNWDDISGQLNIKSPVSRIAFNPKNAREIYISTGIWYWSSLVSGPKTGDGLFKSTDGGETFIRIQNEFSSFLVQDVDVLGNTVYVTTRKGPDTTDDWEGVYKSEDSGQTWKRLIDSRKKFGFEIGGISHVAIDPKNKNVVIVSISSWPDENGKEVSFILSQDGGQTWKEVTEKEPIQYTHELKFTGDGRVYAQDYYRPFMKSADGGKIWEWSASGIRTSRVHSLEIHPTNRNVVFAGTTDGALHKSYDGGKTWTRIATKLSATYISSIAFDPKDSTKFYFGVSGPTDAATGRHFGASGYDTGLYFTQDSGKTFVKFTNLEDPGGDEGNRNQLEIYDVLVHPTNPNLILVGTASEGVYRSEDGGKTWKEANNGIPQDRFYWNQGLEPEGGMPRAMCDEVYERYKNGEKKTSACFYYATRTSMNLFVNSHNENEIWYTTLSGIFVSKDLGKTWNWLSDDLKNIHTHFMAFDPSDASTIYVGTHQGAIDKNGKVIDSSKGLLISRNGGKTWNQVANGPGEGRDIRAIAVNRKDTNFVAVGTDGPLFVSEDKGATWKEVSLKGVEGVDEIRIDNTTKVMYLGTRTSGVWKGILNYDASSPAIIEITGVSSPSSVKMGEKFDIIVSVDNLGGGRDSLPITLNVGDYNSVRTVKVLSAEGNAVRFSLSLSKAGSYDINVNGINYGKVSTTVFAKVSAKAEDVKKEPEKTIGSTKKDIGMENERVIGTGNEKDAETNNVVEPEHRKNFIQNFLDSIVAFFRSLFNKLK